MKTRFFFVSLTFNLHTVYGIRTLSSRQDWRIWILRLVLSHWSAVFSH
ncbi:hypothetical protein HID58_052340 [Brassica napus]|uniref:Uncharacterized protein n=1 Tax=Brassica napus TaxID=3708 RepID=A0ABQ8ACP7_BRANA|nr:hypothetical protein HID58_052340 [Brassica napus]